MTTCTGLGPLPEFLETRESRKAVRTIFAAEGVPLAIISEREQKLPLDSLAGLFHRAAQQTGDCRFGLDVGLKMPPGDYGLWARYALQAPTLGCALSRVVRTLHVHQSGTSMRISSRPDGHVAWEYCHPGAGTVFFRQHADHLAPVMIRFAQAYLGPDWRPLAVEVGYPRPPDASLIEAATETTWTFGHSCQAILMPSAALHAVRAHGGGLEPDSPLIGYADVVAMKTLEETHEPVSDIASIIAMRLLDGRSDIEGAASLLGSGRRKIQRRLDEQGLTYRALVTEIRMGRARSLVEGTEASLKRIGLELGYTDPAHFTRAFSRYFGFPPSRLRDRRVKR